MAGKVGFSEKSYLRFQHLSRKLGQLYDHEEIINGNLPTKVENGSTKLDHSKLSAALKSERKSREPISSLTDEDLIFLQRLDPHERALLLHAEESGQAIEVSREQNRAMAEAQLAPRKIRPPVHSRIGLSFQQYPALTFEEAAAQDAAEVAAAQAAAQAEQARLEAIRVKAAATAAAQAAAAAEATARAAVAQAEEEERKRLEWQKGRNQFEEDEDLYRWFAKFKGKQPTSISRSAKQLNYIKKLKAKEETKGGKRTRKLK
jgi:hypothetical protein